MPDTTASVPNAVAATPRRREGRNVSGFLQQWGTLIIFVIIVVGASTQSSAFLTYRNLTNLLQQTSGVGIMSVGMLFVILTRGIDLSVGSVSALGSVVSAMMVAYLSPAASIGVVILAGCASGLVAGITIAYLRLPPFVMTLAVMTMARGIAFILSDGQPIMLSDSGQAIANFANGFLFGLPQPVILMFAVFIIGGIILNFTKFGRLIKAIGSNPEAVRLSGVVVPRYVVAVYVISGALAALAGVISTGRAGVGSATVGVGAELQVIAAVVIGGASLMGGRGGVFNALLGALVLGIIGNIMNLASVPGYTQQVFMGVIIMIAVMIQQGATIFRR
jgi:ribose/xylose/arabinose/galactoside ABC-type transport system permease subunit